MAVSMQSVGRLADPLHEGLRVRHIANFGLTTCKSTDDPEEVFSRQTLAEFDQIPVLEEGRIVAVLERKAMGTERKAGGKRLLDESILVSADEHLGGFIFTLKYQPYRLVVDGTAIRGIVTWSDLLKTPVLLFAYSLLAQLELLMNEAIVKKYENDDDWMKELEAEDKKLITGRKRRLERENLLLPTIELADFAHKAKVIRISFLSRFHFDSDLANLVKLRNSVAHVHKVVRNDADLHRFVEQLETTMAWTKALSKARPRSAKR